MSPQSREDRLIPYLHGRESVEELLLLGRKDEALHNVEQFRVMAEEQGDEDFRLLFESLAVRISQADDPRHIELLNEAVGWEDAQQLPREPIFYLYIGEYFSANQDYGSAITWYTEALNVDQTDGELMRLMGVAILNQGDPETAMKWFEAALTASDNKDSCTWREIAFTQMRLGEKEKALQSMEEAVNLRPDLWRHDLDKLQHLIKGGPAVGAVMPPPMPTPFSPTLISQPETESGEEESEPADSLGEDDMIIGANGGTLPPETQNLEPDAVVQEASFGNTNSGSDTSVDSTSLLEKVRAAAISLHRESLHEFQDRFLGKSKLSPEKAYWFFLRRAAVPCGKEGNRFGYTSGGGDFLWNRGSGTIIDPGRDFLDHLQRIGGSLADVRNIVITNDNDSHLGQFETIRKLLLHGNLAKNVRFFLNLGAIQKLSGVIDLNDKSFSEGYLTLHSGAKYPLLGGGEIKAIPAYHQELKSVDQAVGVVLNLTGPAQENKTILYTSATGLFPLTFSYDSTENRIVHISDKHQIERIISRRYKDEIGTGVDLMVVHLGSTNVQFEKPSDAQASQTAIKTNEFQHADLAQRPKLEELPELCCSGRLGYLGVREVIAECKPKLAVVNEWDRETMPLRADLCKLLKAQCDEILTGEPELPTIVPGDLTLVYDIFADAIYDCVRCDWMPAKDIDFALEKPCPCSPEEVFYFPSEQRDTFESMPKFFVDRYLNALKFQQELHFYRL